MITKVSSFEPIFDEINKYSLLILDIDRVVMISKDKIFRPCGDQLSAQLSKQYFQPLPEVTRKKLISTIMLQAERELIFPDLGVILSQLHAQGIHSLALTACDVGDFGHIPCLEEWRYQQLRDLGIRFKGIDSERLVLDQLPVQKYPYPVYQNNILYSTDYTKGETLDAFLKATDYHPSKGVIFVDDILRNVETVSEILTKRQIFFHCFHFVGALTAEESVNEEIANYQHRYLIEQKEWLSDQTVACYLNRTS